MIAAVLVATPARADVVPYVEPSVSTGVVVDGPYSTDKTLRVAVGAALRDSNELHLGAWLELEKLDANETTGYGGVEVAYDVAIQPALSVGPRIALGINNNNRLVAQAGARVTYQSIWLGIDVANVSAGVGGGYGEPMEHTALELGFGVTLHPSPVALAYTAGGVATVLTAAAAMVILVAFDSR